MMNLQNSSNSMVPLSSTSNFLNSENNKLRSTLSSNFASIAANSSTVRYPESSRSKLLNSFRNKYSSWLLLEKSCNLWRIVLVKNSTFSL